MNSTTEDTNSIPEDICDSSTIVDSNAALDGCTGTPENTPFVTGTFPSPTETLSPQNTTPPANSTSHRHHFPPSPKITTTANGTTGVNLTTIISTSTDSSITSLSFHKNIKTTTTKVPTPAPARTSTSVTVSLRIVTSEVAIIRTSSHVIATTVTDVPTRSKLPDQFLLNNHNASITKGPGLVSVSKPTETVRTANVSLSTLLQQHTTTSTAVLPSSSSASTVQRSATVTAVAASTPPPEASSSSKSSKLGTSGALAITFGIVSLFLILFILRGMVVSRRKRRNDDHRTPFQGQPSSDIERVRVRSSSFDPHIYKLPFPPPSQYFTEDTRSNYSQPSAPGEHNTPTNSPAPDHDPTPSEGTEPSEPTTRTEVPTLRVEPPEVPQERTTPRPSLSDNRTPTTYHSTQLPQYEESLASNEVRLAGGPVVRMGRAL